MTNRAVKKLNIFTDERFVKVSLKVCASVMLACALALTFTVGDYYIFSRWAESGFLLCLSHWMKKAGIILITLAVFFGCKSCADTVKYCLPVFLVLGCCLFGGFFNITPAVAEGQFRQNFEIFRKINTFFPVWLNTVLYFLQTVAMAACCGLLFIRDGYRVKAKSFIAAPLSVAASLPLNLFENFFEITPALRESFLWFKNFTLWHFLAICVLAGVTVGAYFFLKNKSREQQDKYLAAVAVTLLLQYHSKDSLLLSDGYNVYNTVIAVLPLFICNMGVYVASASVIFKKRALYAISFFVHAVGALTVFIYFGKNEMSNYGIFCSYSILYFCLTHCLLFVLCVIPSALGHYTFKIKDCIIPLIYYFIVIAVAAVASTLVSYASTFWVADDGVTHLIYDGVYVQGFEDGVAFMKPNFAFTQTNPLPLEIPNLIPTGGAFRYINLFYVILVYMAYVCLFFTFYGAYTAFIYIRRAVLKAWAERRGARPIPVPEEAEALPEETAATQDEPEAK